MQYIFQLTTEQFEALINRILDKKLSEITGSVTKSEHKESSDLIKIDEAAGILHVTRKTIFTWIKSGKLICHRLGGRLYFKRQDINNCLQANFRK